MNFDRKVVFLFLLILNINFIICDQADDQPGSNEDFIAIHKDAVGVSEQLNPQMRSLMAMAIQFLPINYKYTSVISATREVVAGVRFNLFVSALDGNESEVVCFFDVLEKPWITTDFGQKLRLLQYTNCTADGEDFVPEATADPSQYNINPIFTKNRDKPMTEARLSELESQISDTVETEVSSSKKHSSQAETGVDVEHEEKITRTNVAPSETQPTDSSSPVAPTDIPNDLQQQIQLALENIFNTNEDLKRALEEISVSSSNVEEIKQRYEAVFEQLVQAIIRNIFNHTESINDTFTYEFPIKLSSKDPNSKVTGAVVYIEKELETETSTSTSSTDSDKDMSPRRRRAIGESQSKTMESKGLVHVKEQVAHRVTEILCENCQNSYQNQLEHDCVKYCKNNNKNDLVKPGSLVGGIEPADDPATFAEVEAESTKAVSQLRHTDGSQCSYKKVDNVSKQVVSGILYRATVHHECGGELKKCQIEIWSQPWMGPPQNKWTCEEYKSHKISKRGLLGGHNELTEEKKERAEELARSEVLKQSELAGEKCEHVRVVKGTYQVVNGIYYHLTTEVNCNGEKRECEHNIVDKSGAKTKKFECKVVDHNISKRGLLGGHNELTDEKKQRAEELARAEVPKQAELKGEKCEHVRVVKGTYQVVSGIYYHLTTEVDCNGEKRQCEHNIVEKAGHGAVETKKYECIVASRRRRESLLGGVTPIDESEFGTLEQMVVDALSFASAKDDNKNYNFIKINSATKQVVSGISYQIEVQTKDDDSNNIQCTMRIWSQPWRDSGNDVKMTCDEQTYKFRTKRSVRSHHHVHLHEGRTFTNKGEEHMQHLFEKFKIKHKRVYSDNDEHQRRYKIFRQNLYKIEQLNRMEQGTAKYGITDFADLTKEEYKLRTGLVIPEPHENAVKNPMADIMTDLELPTEYDWRKKEVVSEVKNQGSCGSCWAFSAVGNIEGQHAIKYGKLESYSEQELVDCDTKDNGCGGGYMDDAFKAIETLGGIELETEYPYSAKREKCHFDSSRVHARVTGAVDLPKNETAIAQFLVQNGPIAIGLNANAMQFYRGGVSKPWKVLCGAKSIDHGVLIVGYGVAEYPRFNKTLPYWIIKNSWGPKWGEQGYYRLYRGDNRCGVSEMASSAVIE